MPYGENTGTLNSKPGENRLNTIIYIKTCIYCYSLLSTIDSSTKLRNHNLNNQSYSGLVSYSPVKPSFGYFSGNNISSYNKQHPSVED